MADATDTRPDIDPDRAGFTIAVHAARRSGPPGRGRAPSSTWSIDLVGAICRLILANLMPDRRIPGQPPRGTTSHTEIQRQSAPYRSDLVESTTGIERPPRPTKPVDKPTKPQLAGIGTSVQPWHSCNR
jgi:hypothetical protein